MGELQVRSVGMSGGMPVIESDDPIPGLEVDSVYIPGPRGLQYGGQFRGTWDMSSGSTGPAAPATDYQATHTDTTITPDAHLTSSGTMYIAGSQSLTIPLLTSGVAQASITKAPYMAGDNVFGYNLFISDASLTLEQLEAAANGRIPLPSGTRFISIAIIHGGSQSATISAYNNGITGSANATGFTSGNAYLRYDYATGDAVMVINGISYGPVNLPFVSGMKLTAVIHCTSPDVVFAAGHISVNFSDTSDPLGSFVFTDTSGGATLSDGGATVTFPSATGYAVNNGFAAFSGKVAIPFRLNSDLPDGATVLVGLQVSPNYASWVWNGAVALIEYHDPDADANLALNDHNVSCARSGEFCLLVDIDARTSSIIIPGGTTVLGSTSPAAACGYPVVELASGTYPGGVTLLPTSSYTLPAGYQIITG